MADEGELDRFLRGVEKRAWRHALFAVGNRDTALDIVQEAMLRLVHRYGNRPEEELPLLFQRILQNHIRDHFRRQKVRNLWTTPLSQLLGDSDDDGGDPLDWLAADDERQASLDPARVFADNQLAGVLEETVAALPLRQRQALLLRYWEGMSTAETAEAMGCSEGSVKTHCSRAVHALAVLLRERGIEP